MEISLEEARKMCSDPQSGFTTVHAEQHISLPPRFQTRISEGVRQQLDAKIGFACDKFDGAVIGYSNVRLLTDKGLVIDDAPYINFRISADFIVFQPRVGARLQGVVNKIGKDHIGLVVHGHFNVSIRLTSGQPESTVSKGDLCQFTVVRVHTHRHLLSMIGKLV
ncbi:DNA-directed RNA polymerase I subunit RPA43-like [Babylonia areolata]|uniref:DNA-directed RNA polymerase I subunit RPA43-like n=1 Tax=Babylonia areolata TaxID=304850 RepID=UPI003FD0D426